MAAKSKTLKELQALKQSGQLSDRQQTRLNYLQQQEQQKKPAPQNQQQKPQQQQKKKGVNVIKDPEVKQAVKEDIAVADIEAKKGIQYANVNQEGPFGSRTYEQDAQGNIIQKDVLDPEQQAIVDADTQLSQMGRDIAQQQIGNFAQQFNPQLAQRTSQGDMLADRARIEDEVFARLTRDFDDQENRERQRLEQRLYETGNVPGTPNYEREMQAFNSRFDRARQEARQNAVSMGGEEWARGFNINEALIGNQLNQAGQIRNQQLGELSTFANFGPGARLPNFQGFQGVQYDLNSPSEINSAFTQLDQNQQALNLKRAGAGGAPAQQSPFNNTPPPYLGG